jgi:hypothetical protein
MQTHQDLLWAATPVHKKGTRFHPQYVGDGFEAGYRWYERLPNGTAVYHNYYGDPLVVYEEDVDRILSYLDEGAWG